ncbi:F-type H+-transporting ATPase subunit delta [Perilla frutescens var. hirtella]|uniref:F-type H+-transporting ATPase subunit delta n=1 Tax=Perilla frutescens var. hirtella TaxID=608512 RepID=A0AAD4J634_PERFH|nr:F-type H+-transporting ATPase subunit delta [Perilla frutescens var. frutescens]KAH6827852.1 F-type H+-transporting ATPase subunit delta [Perilla frutescens var. hirtella]
MATAAALQQTPITLQYRSPPSTEHHSKPTTRLALTSTLKTCKLTVKPLLRRRARRGGGARMADTAASSYANALADVAKSNNTLDRTFADVEKIEKFFSDESVLGFFTNPTIVDEVKRGIVDEIAKSSALQPHVANFLSILVDMKRIDLVKEIVKEFEAVYNDLTATELAVVTSVVKLESQHLAQIAKGVQKLTGAKNVRIKTAIDPGLVAGFTIRYGNSGSKLIDMSVKKQLEEIAAQLDLGDIQLAV